MSRDRRIRLLEWAQRNVLIVEDDPYGAPLHFDDVATPDETRPIQADDAEGRVVYLSTFSKTVAPGLRVAWITGPTAIVDKLEVARQSIDLCTGSLDQRLVYGSGNAAPWRRVGTHAGSEARLSIAAPSHERIENGVRRLASAVSEELESSEAAPQAAGEAPLGAITHG